MIDEEDKLGPLIERLENLMEKQESFSREVNHLKDEIEVLKKASRQKNLKTADLLDIDKKAPSAEILMEPEKVPVSVKIKEQPAVQKKESDDSETGRFSIKKDLEKFIGENLINKVGIVITVIGVAIGAKYAIDHELLSPLTRIILGYLAGFSLLGFAIHLRKNYENFSAVLLSGSMAIVYFITYFAYSFYSLLPQLISFALMILITTFTVTAAIKYNRQVIAHIGLVGAYAVPFLLSDGTGDVMVLFSYTAIINIGILVIAVKKYWKPLSYSSFIITWLLYLVWYGSNYDTEQFQGMASLFLSVFFITFYLMFLAYKLIKKEKFDVLDIILLLSNSFIFYGVGYSILGKDSSLENKLGLFTLANAVVHLIVSLIIYRQKLADRNLFYFVSGLVLIFITIAIPVQLNGNWVTLLWVGEAALLFWIGRTKYVSFYEVLSYGLMFVAFFSLMHDWSPLSQGFSFNEPDVLVRPFFNTGFLTSLLFIASFSYINVLNSDPRYPSPIASNKELLKLFSVTAAGVLLLVLYYSVRIEITNYWDHIIDSSSIKIKSDEFSDPGMVKIPDMSNFKVIWLINYSLLFFSAFSFVNIIKLRSQLWGYINLVINTLIIIIFLTQGLYLLSELRESYITQPLTEYYHSGSFNISIRYISLIFAGLMLFAINQYVRRDFLKSESLNLKRAFDLLVATFAIWVLSSELLSWLDIMDYTQSYKLSLSILWGTSALALISIGIWKKKQHLRISAIVLFGITLIKLFVYDISHLDTISKTIVFVTLGVLLLVISFLYNKYRHIIAGEIKE